MSESERSRIYTSLRVQPCSASASAELTASSPKRFVALIQSLESLTTSQPFRCGAVRARRRSRRNSNESDKVPEDQGSHDSRWSNLDRVPYASITPEQGESGPASQAHLLPSEAGSNRGFPPSGNRHHAPFADRIFDGTPSDAVRAKACQPNDKVNGIANRDKPDIPPQNLVSYAPYPNGPCHTGTQD